MAISYNDFLTQVRNYTEVDSNVLTDSIIDQFIRNTELDVAGKVDYDDIRRYATSSFTTGKRFLLMPGEFLVARSFQVFDSTDLSGERTFLEKKDTSFMSEYSKNVSNGQPKFYANWDDNTIIVAPTPDQGYAVQLNYIIDPPHFDSSTNTYLAQYQEAMLLHGVLTEAFSFLKGPMDMYNLYQNKYNQGIDAFALQQMGRRRRDEYGEGVPRIQVPSPSPNT